MPPPSNAKTDLEMLTKTASPTIAHTNFKFDNARFGEPAEESTKPVENDVKLEFPYTKSHRDKRSLFDMDNAASLSLAEKLRNEANKYSNNDVSTIVGNKHLAGKTEDNERKSDSTPSSPAHHGMAAERRPSWRLKFDAGSKVRVFYCSNWPLMLNLRLKCTVVQSHPLGRFVLGLIDHLSVLSVVPAFLMFRSVDVVNETNFRTY